MQVAIKGIVTIIMPEIRAAKTPELMNKFMSNSSIHLAVYTFH